MTKNTATELSTPQVNSVMHAIRILELFAIKQKQYLTLGEISLSLQIHKTTVYRILRTLQKVGWIKQNENKEKAWSEYVRLCEAGGSKSFLKLVEVANLKNPFVDGTIASVIPQINDYLDKVDDKKL